MADNYWEVVGGKDKGGILVKKGQSVGSEVEKERLSCGAVIREVELHELRLHYKLVKGYGPETGWITTALKGKDLAVRSYYSPEKRPEYENSPPDDVKEPEVGFVKASTVEKSSTFAPDTPAAPQAPPEKGLFAQRIKTDAKVKIVGLKSEAFQKYNGKNGAIRRFDGTTGRYVVKVVVLSELGGAGEKSGNATFLDLKFENLEIHRDQIEKDQVLNGDEIVLMGAGDAKRQLYEVKLDPQYWYDKAIERVLDAKNDFEVLDLPVEKIEDMSKLKKQYRRISLAVHPDKNKHPQATDAFRKVYGAFETIMDIKQQRRMLWILGKLSKDEEDAVTFDEEEEDELFQWWWEATVPQIEKQAAEFEGQRLDEFGAMWISDGLGGNAEDVKWIGLETAKRLHAEDKAIFLDVRDMSDFIQGHIANAYAVPLLDVIDYGLVNILMAADQMLVSNMLKNKHKPIIIYSEVATPFSRCRAFCRWLLRAGHSTLKPERLRRLRGGMFGWKHKEGPVSRPLMDQKYELAAPASEQDVWKMGGFGGGVSNVLLGNDAHVQAEIAD